MYDSVGVPLAQRPRRPRLYLSRRERGFRAREIEALPRPRIAVAPHGPPGVRLPNKVYPFAQWLEVAPRLAALAGAVLQVGSTGEGPLLPGAHDHRDLGFRCTAGVLARCDLLLTHVGGIMHLGAAVDVPAVVLYGAAEHPAISGYDWNWNLYTPIECGPCWMETACWHLSCMRRLAPDVVLDAVRAALEGAPPGTRAIGAPAGLGLVPPG
jgi:ADP-heptose:LPS heptosyltransferase